MRPLLLIFLLFLDREDTAVWEAGEDEGSGRYLLRNVEYDDPKAWPSWKPELNMSIKMQAQRLVKRTNTT